MRSNRFRCVYKTNDKKYVFSTDKFREVIDDFIADKRSKGEKTQKKDVYEVISDTVGVTPDAVKNWRNGLNGPSDIHIVKDIASSLNVDFMKLLEEQKQEKDTIMNNPTYVTEFDNVIEENMILRGLLNKLTDVVMLYGRSKCFENMPDSTDSAGTYYEEMLNNVDYELHKKRWYITEENYRKLFRLLMETRVLIYFFCDHSINRWIDIEPGFIFINYKVRVGDEYTDFDDFIFHGTDNEEFAKEEIEYLAKEFEDYIQGDVIFQDPCETFGYCAGKWYTNIIKHDFPELFV